MRATTALRAFLVMALVPLVALPAYNLRDAAARTYAQRLFAERKVDRLQQLAYNVDFLVAAWNALTWRTGLSTDPQKVIVGRDGWLFMGDRYANNLSAQRLGAGSNDAELAAGIGNNLLAWESWLRTQGVQAFVLQIGPDKHRVHPEYLPGWASLGKAPRVELLTRGPARRLISDPAAALQQAAAKGQPMPYYKTDSHWNLWGAAIAMRDLRQTLHTYGVSLQTALPDPPQVDRVDRREGGDLSAFLRIQHQVEEFEPLPLGLEHPRGPSDIRDLATNAPVAPAPHGQLQHPRLTLQVVTPSAANPLKVLWLRDSFGSALAPFFAADFRETIQIHWSYGLNRNAMQLVNLVHTHRPDVVVLTLVERVALAELLLTQPPGQ
ncbi:MAG: hypothetical protein MUF76_04820 [Hydrogenophaga sp.]|jgi:hypothetical protein|nr:hypothetical protein [Hydrogenophaga sp.]